jgi:RNA polymerase sigma-70 factor (ECF subfamily)
MDTIELVNLCRQGDLDAFNNLYNNYSKKALRITYLIVGNKNIAEDIVQEAFYECYRNIKKLRNPAMFDAWFNKLLIRICWRMSAKERNLVCESLDETYGENISSNTTVTDPFENFAINEAVRKAINKLNIPLRTTVILFYYNDMSIKEISKVLNCMQGTVKSRLHNARKYIENELRKDNIILSTKEIKYMNKECAINE